MTDASAPGAGTALTAAKSPGMDVRLTAYAFGHLSARTAPGRLVTRAVRPARVARRRAELPPALRRRRAGTGLGPDLTRLASGSRQGLHY